jgi:hypothetical protein
MHSSLQHVITDASLQSNWQSINMSTIDIIMGINTDLILAAEFSYIAVLGKFQALAVLEIIINVLYIFFFKIMYRRGRVQWTRWP